MDGEKKVEVDRKPGNVVGGVTRRPRVVVIKPRRIKRRVRRG